MIPKDLTRISLYDSLSFNENWFDYDVKIIIYGEAAIEMAHVNRDWEPLIEEFPEVAFIFIVNYPDSLKLMRNMKKIGPRHPFLYDRKNIFHKKYSGMEQMWTSYSLITKNNKSEGAVHAMMPGMREKILELLDD